ncbi:hypothetical protein NHQ30_008725 [Ciborinia camelliae]|nr:hypothetical protein NHQ30_008725 [Ciborinia camelliae]
MSTTSPLPRRMNDETSTNPHESHMSYLNDDPSANERNPHESQISYFKDDSSANESIHRNVWQRFGLENGHRETNGNRNRNTDHNTNRGCAGSNIPIAGHDDDDDDGVDGVDQQPDTLETAVAKVGIRDRVGCTTWAWFTLTMATGGIANVLYSTLTSYSPIPVELAANRGRNSILP